MQDILPNALTDAADVVLPAAAWAEKDGCWENFAGKIQPFSAAIRPIEVRAREGDVYFGLMGWPGMYRAEDVRRQMGEPFALVKRGGCGKRSDAWSLWSCNGRRSLCGNFLNRCRRGSSSPSLRMGWCWGRWRI